MIVPNRGMTSMNYMFFMRAIHEFTSLKSSLQGKDAGLYFVYLLPWIQFKRWIFREIFLA